MRFIINGVDYPGATVDRVTGALALELTRQTKFGVKTLVKRLEECDRLGYDEHGAVVVLPAGDPGIEGSGLVTESEPHFKALLALVWLARWQSGEHLSFADATDFPLVSLEVALEADDEEADEEADPTSPAPQPSPQGHQDPEHDVAVAAI